MSGATGKKTGRFERVLSEKIEVVALKYVQPENPSRFKPVIDTNTIVHSTLTGKTTRR
jgi:hypothetical protein